jgi:hypothetical protein
VALSGNLMKHVNAFANEIDEIVGSPKFQTYIDNGSKDDVSKEPLDRLITLDEVTKQEVENKMSLNTFQLWSEITQQCYNNF